MKAILWDGKKQLEGELSLTGEGLFFKLYDFEKTDLNFSILHTSIQRVNQYSLYNLTANGVEIWSKGGKRNVFIVEDSRSLIKKIEKGFA